MSTSLAAIQSDRRFEKIIVAFFLSLPLIGGAVVLYHALQDQRVFWLTVLFTVAPILIFAAHVKWVRPRFRNIPWLASYSELWRVTKRFKASSVHAKNPALFKTRILPMWRRRIGRTLYRVAFAIAIVPFIYGLHVLHGHHFWWFAVMYLIAGLGVTAGYHRGGAHPAYQSKGIMRTILLGAGCLALQGPPAEWIRKHIKHHRFADTTWDPHSPLVFEESKIGMLKEQVRGFAHSFIMWAFREPSMRRMPKESIEDWEVRLRSSMPPIETFQYPDDFAEYWENDAGGRLPLEKRLNSYWNSMVDKYVKLERDKSVRFLSIWWVYLLVLVGFGFALPYFLGGITVWESLARILVLSWVTYAVNSVCHLWGEQPFDTADNSHNNAFVEVFGFGEGSHNTHHRHAGWAAHGAFHWQLDISSFLIKGLTKLKLIEKPRFPSKRELLKAWYEYEARQEVPLRHPKAAAVQAS